MDRKRIEQLLEDVQAGRIGVEQAVETLRHLPFEDIGFARIDHHRSIRCGYPEVIFCLSKSPEQVREIFLRLAETGHNVLATRADEAVYASVREAIRSADLVYEREARILAFRQQPICTRRGYIAIVTAGTADLPVAAEARVTAEMLGSRVRLFSDVGVAGLHRVLACVPELQQADVVIVVAGMEGALASVVGGLVDCPVVAVPTSVGYGASFEGLSALLTMLNSCAAGVMVVNIDNGFGAAYGACQIHRNLCAGRGETDETEA